MDPHAIAMRRRAVGAITTITATRRALGAALAAPARDEEITTSTPAAEASPRRVMTSLGELSTLLRLATPARARAADRRRDLVLQAALELASSRLGEIASRQPTRDTLAACKLAVRTLTRWLAKEQATAASISTVPRQKKTGYRDVLIPAAGRQGALLLPIVNPEAQPAAAAGQPDRGKPAAAKPTSPTAAADQTAPPARQATRAG